MARLDNAYSRAIAIIKVILPLIALGILSTLFLLSRPGSQGEPLPYSDLALSDLARDQRLGAPVYTSVTEDGAELRLSADSLTPDPDRPGLSHGRDLIARVTRGTQITYDLLARTGSFNDRTQQAELQGGVRIVTGDGYVITSPRAWLRSDFTRLEATGPVIADGPIGRLNAGGLSIRTDAETNGSGVALFHGGVKLLYVPPTTHKDPRP